MTNLTKAQESLLEGVRKTYEDVTPILTRLQEEYEYADYRAKRPLRDAIDVAREAGVPMSRIVKEATEFTYPQALTRWLEPAPSVQDRLSAPKTEEPQPETETFAEELEDIRTVVRDGSTGIFKVNYKGFDYEVRAIGPDEEPWTTREEDVPSGVYELIESEYPGFVVLEED